MSVGTSMKICLLHTSTNFKVNVPILFLKSHINVSTYKTYNEFLLWARGSKQPPKLEIFVKSFQNGKNQTLLLKGGEYVVTRSRHMTYQEMTKSPRRVSYKGKFFEKNNMVSNDSKSPNSARNAKKYSFFAVVNGGGSGPAAVFYLRYQNLG